MNKIDWLFQQAHRPVLSIYFTAGYPRIDSLHDILPALEAAGTHMVEIGIPFSDPMADGPIIQKSSQQALKNGMNLELLFKQLEETPVSIPVVLMGYFNPVMQFGIARFLKRCQETGVSGIIIPDMPPEIQQSYESLFLEQGIYSIFLVTPQTPPERVRLLAQKTRGFLYAVSTASVTGNKGFAEANQAYLSRLRQDAGKTPVMIGFGIKTRQDFLQTAQFADGAIIGSRFIQVLEENYLTNRAESLNGIYKFVREISS